MFDYRNGRKSAVDPGNGVHGFSHRSRAGGEVELDPRREALGRRVAVFSYRYAWAVHLVLIPALLAMVALRIDHPMVFVIGGWLILLGLPMVLVGRVVANKLTLLDEPKSYDAVKVYCVGMLLHFAFWLLFGIANKGLG